VQALDRGVPDLPFGPTRESHQRFGRERLGGRAVLKRVQRRHHLELVFGAIGMLQQDLRGLLILQDVADSLQTENCAVALLLVLRSKQLGRAPKDSRLTQQVKQRLVFAGWNHVCSPGSLDQAVDRRDVVRLAPVVTHRASI